MSGRMRGSSCLKPMRTSTVAFCRSAVGTVVMTCAGICQSGYASSTAVTSWPGLHAVDVALVDVDLDLERAHVDDRADAGAREAAAGRHRRDHLAGLRVLRDRDAAERRADDRVVEIRSARSSTCRSATLTCCASARDARVDRVDLGLRRVDVGLRDEPSLSSELPTRRASACASASRTSFSRDVAPRAPRSAPRPAPAPRGTSRRRAARAPGPRVTAMPSSTLTSIDLAGDLRRHRRAPPRGDVARRVQHRRPAVPAARSVTDATLDLDRPFRASPSDTRQTRRRRAAMNTEIHPSRRPRRRRSGSRSIFRPASSSLRSGIPRTFRTMRRQ